MSQIISIIVPVYNVEKYLDECIKSIVNQSYKDLEIILVNDGSTDGSLAICETWGERDGRIKIISQENAGLSAARNTGLSAATGEYVYFVDSDDYISSELCERSIDRLRETKADIACFDIMRVDDAGNNRGMIENGQGDSLIKGEAALVHLVSGEIHDSACNKLIKRGLFNGVAFPVGCKFEDLGTTYKLFLKSKEICFLPEVFYYYRKRSDSIIGSMSIDALCDLFLMRITRQNDLAEEYPLVAECGVALTALSALALYDRCLWERTDRPEPQQAEDYLEKNKKKILTLDTADKFKLYYKNRFLYNFCRVQKHRIGNIIKKFKG